MNFEFIHAADPHSGSQIVGLLVLHKATAMRIKQKTLETIRGHGADCMVGATDGCSRKAN